MKLYCFARADAMKDHNFTDDVAITWAMNKKEAIARFSELYAEIKPKEVFQVKYNSKGIAILTDY